MAKRQRTSELDPPEKTYFEQHREALISDISTVRCPPPRQLRTEAAVKLTEQSFEHVLANINKLNRSLESVIEVRLPPLQVHASKNAG
jgi:hypothetical protein